MKKETRDDFWKVLKEIGLILCRYNSLNKFKITIELTDYFNSKYTYKICNAPDAEQLLLFDNNDDYVVVYKKES